MTGDEVGFDAAPEHYRCDACGFSILPGLFYVRIGALYDGSWSTIRAHGDCESLAQRIQLDVCGQPTYTLDLADVGGLRGLVAEHRDHGVVADRWRQILRTRQRERRAYLGLFDEPEPRAGVGLGESLYMGAVWES